MLKPEVLKDSNQTVNHKEFKSSELELPDASGQDFKHFATAFHGPFDFSNREGPEGRRCFLSDCCQAIVGDLKKMTPGIP